ncbi:hypothetical protein [Paenibacillus oleatilyticus]|uniref:hypothetical protein n=1 Tax=Paenibacillus oleatilyticus TaxID=2594886 RepID=UPI001C1F4145|nr:hypothetical protein [Paenibacillus oleatilyticus]MBU7319521.1 hypothetical protein [Paenibacillus oleatilyticus]
MSKKLEGNGLWESSRMMLPQHKEQSLPIQSNLASLPSKLPTNKEVESMRDYIILSVALQIVEKKSREMEASSQMLKLLYTATAKVLVKIMREDMQKLKKVLFQQNIRVFEESKDDTSLYYRFVCRGHEERFTMTKDFIRAEISVKIGNYAKKFVSILHEAARNK